MVKRRAFFLTLTILIASCSIDYGDNSLPDKLLEDVPDNILYDFIYTKNEDSHKSLSIYAHKAEIFEEKQQTILSGVVFQQFDNNSNITAEGKAEKGILFTSNDNVEISGEIVIYSSQEEAELATSYLFWNKDAKILEGKSDTGIKITRDSGTVISGKGFTGDMTTKTYSLNSDVTGEYVYDQK